MQLEQFGLEERILKLPEMIAINMKIILLA